MTVNLCYAFDCRDKLAILEVNKNNIVWGPGYQGKNDANQGQTNSTGMPSPKEVDKAE
jgi:hypothetical protein